MSKRSFHTAVIPVSQDVGRDIDRWPDNLRLAVTEAIAKLANEYPSHDFVGMRGFCEHRPGRNYVGYDWDAVVEIELKE